MPWYFPWSESIKKRACRYLLQHYLGDFLKEKLTLEQLTVDLYNGKGRVSDVPLDVWALNEMLENVGIPLEIIDGFISSISVSVPWTSLLSDNCQIEVNGMELTFSPKRKLDPWNHANMFDSSVSWNSMNMTTSIQLAEQCLNQGRSAGEEQAESAQMFEGLEAFAQTIESVLSRIKLTFTNMLIRVEHIPPGGLSGVGLELHIDRIEYSDLSFDELLGGEAHLPHSVYEPVAIAIKNFQIFGLRLYIDEFSSENRTRLRETEEKDSCEEDNNPDLNNGLGKLVFDDQMQDGPRLMPQVQVLGSHGKQNIKLKLKQNDSLPGPKIDLDYFFGAINIFLTPRQLHLILDIANNISFASSNADESKERHRKSTAQAMNFDDLSKLERTGKEKMVNFSKKTANNPDIWQNTFNCVNKADLLKKYPSHDSTSDEEFYSMSDYNSLPPLGQPPMLNVETRGKTIEDPSMITGTNSDRVLSNVSLGGSNSLLNAMNSTPPKGSLAEQAGNVFKASANQVAASNQETKLPHVIKSPRSHSNSGLVGISSLDDPCDLSHIKLRSSNIIIVLLHQEPLDTSKFEKEARIISSEHMLNEISNDFFKDIGKFSMQNLFGELGEETRRDLSSYCCYDHMRFLMSAVTCDFETRSISGNKSFCADFVIGKSMIDENLYDRKRRKTFPSLPVSQTKLLCFASDQTMSVYPSGFGSAAAPCIKIKIQKTERGRSPLTTVQSRATILPKSLVNIQLSKLEAEFDMSIVDRIAAVLSPGPLYRMTSNTAEGKLYSSFLSGGFLNRQTAFSQAIEESPLPYDSKTDITLSCPIIKLSLRFPIPDLRPASDIDKRCWWQKALRSEKMQIDLFNLDFKTVLSHSQPVFTFEFRFKEGTGYFQSPEEEIKLFHVAHMHNEDDVEEMHLDWPRIVVRKQLQATKSVFEDVDKDSKSSPDSQFDSLGESFPWMRSEPSPFSSNPVMFEKEELVMPGCVNEMNTFQDAASSTANLSISCNFPELKLNLQDKETFQLIYNRLFNDLFMWEPSAPSPVETTLRSCPPPQGSIHVNFASQLGFPGNERLFMYQSATKDDDSDSDRDTSLSSSIPDTSASDNQMIIQNQQSDFAMSVHIDRGVVVFFPSMQTETENEDECENKPPGQLLGHVAIMANDFNLFIVSHYKGDANLDYLQFYASDATLYHLSYMDGKIDRFKMEDALTTNALKKTINRSEQSVLSRSREAEGVGSDGVSSLSFAMKTKRIPTKNRQDNLVAVGLRGSTLRHRVLGPGESWLSQIMDFLAVEDEAVLGYKVPSVITTLYLHLWGCCIDYRPLHLPLQSLLFVEAFSLSSNISPASPESVLRFILDDSSFYISDKQAGKIDLEKDYVCVMDMGLFELILRLSDGNEKKRPKVDLSMSNNILNIRTCSDSCSALIKLIKYFASDGDIDYVAPPTMKEQDIQNESTENLYSRSTVDENALDSLMADAMLEDDDNDSVRENDGGDLKTFTDRHGFTSSELFSSSGPSNSSSMRSLNETQSDIENDDDYDDHLCSSGDEFCILEPEIDDQILQEIEPVVRKLVNEEIVIIENYFPVPRGRYDQLSAPVGYPTPTHRYTLREMSVVWQMFGGKDFQMSDQVSSSQNQSFQKYQAYSPQKSPAHKSMQSRNRGLLHRKHGQERKNKRGAEQKTGKLKGGIGRENSVMMELHMNKIRYQHEVYPEDVDKISRDVLLIYDLEIRDRLAVSQINKFLYRFASETFPLKSSANMISLKLLLTKPEDGVKNQEGSVRISVQPLRFNIDQDALFFLKTFFTEISEDSTKQPTDQIYEGYAMKKEQDHAPLSTDVTVEEINIKEDHFPSPTGQPATPKDSGSHDQSSVFFRSFLFSPEVPIRLDYQGKSVNLDQGTLIGLIIGLAQLNCSEIKLKRLCCRSGLLGYDKLLSYVINEWLMDIRRNQIPGIIGGVGPAYSFVQLYQGIKDLFWLPVQQYKQDGRLARGLQKGAHSFSTSTAMAVLELTNRLVQTVQAAAETAYDVVSAGPSVTSCSTKRKSISDKANQPADLREGVTNAYNVLSEGISRTATTIMEVATEEHEKKGVTGAVGGVLRQIPPSIMEPFILATEATSNVLGGARNQLSPDARLEATKKWKPVSK